MKKTPGLEWVKNILSSFLGRYVVQNWDKKNVGDFM